MAKLQKQNKNRQRQQSDIVIDSSGKISVSFFWEDLKDLEGIQVGVLEQSPSCEKSPSSEMNDPHDPSLFNLTLPKAEYEKCTLCPRRCGFNRVEKKHPKCGDWNLRISTSGLSLGDEPEIRGTRGSGVIMLAGCPLRCPSCQNYEMVQSGAETSPVEFIELARKLESQGAHNLQILSPTVHLPALRIILETLKRGSFSIPIIFKSSGYEDPEQLRKFEGLVDIYLPDFKFGVCSTWGNRAGAKDYFRHTQNAINEMRRQTGPAQLNGDGTLSRGVLIRHVRAPLPHPEYEQIRRTMEEYSKDGILISVLNNFVALE